MAYQPPSLKGYSRGAGIPGRRFAGRPPPPEPEQRSSCVPDLRNTVITCTLVVVLLGGAFILIEPVENSIMSPDSIPGTAENVGKVVAEQVMATGDVGFDPSTAVTDGGAEADRLLDEAEEATLPKVARTPANAVASSMFAGTTEDDEKGELEEGFTDGSVDGPEEKPEEEEVTEDEAEANAAEAVEDAAEAVEENALPEGAGLEKAPEPEPDTPEEIEEEKKGRGKKGKKKKTPEEQAEVQEQLGVQAQDPKTRKKLQSDVMKELKAGELIVNTKAQPDASALVAAEPPDMTELTDLGLHPETWAKKPSVLHRGFVSKNDKKSTYAHMSTVAVLPPTAPYRYMVAWQAGAKVEGVDGQRLRAAYSDDAVTWTKSFMIPVGDKAVWSPVLFTYEGWVYLFYSVSIKCLRPKTSKRPERWAPGGDILYTKSRDGIHWGPSVSIYVQDTSDGIPKVIANQPEVVNGKFVLPYWKERPTQHACKTKGRTSAGVLVADVGKDNWKPFGEITSKGTWLIEGAVARRPDNSLLQLFRTKAGAIFQSSSADGGKTWSTVTSLGLPNPGSKIDAIRLTSGELALAYNDSPGRRNRLRVALSADGAKWHLLADIEMPGKVKFDYSYPTITQDGNKLLVTYSQWRKAQNIPVDETGIRVVVVELPKPNAKVDKSVPKLGLVDVVAQGDDDGEKVPRRARTPRAPRSHRTPRGASKKKADAAEEEEEE